MEEELSKKHHCACRCRSIGIDAQEIHAGCNSGPIHDDVMLPRREIADDDGAHRSAENVEENDVNSAEPRQGHFQFPHE